MVTQNRCTLKKIYLFFYPYNAFDLNESSHKTDKRTIFLHDCATCSELPSNISIMVLTQTTFVSLFVFLSVTKTMGFRSEMFIYTWKDFTSRMCKNRWLVFILLKRKRSVAIFKNCIMLLLYQWTLIYHVLFFFSSR